MFAFPDANVQTTPVHDAMYRWLEIRPGDIPAEESKRLGATPFSVLANGTYDLFAHSRGVETQGGESSAPRLAGNSALRAEPAVAARAVAAPVEDVATQRMKLLAARYAGGAASAEITARLAILDRRMLALSPRVTQAQLDALEQTVNEIAALRERRLARAALLGLSA